MSELARRAAVPSSIWRHNPVLLQLFGLSPVLAVSTRLSSGIGLGLATLLVLMLSVVATRLLQSFISETWRFLWYLPIVAVFTTVIGLLLQYFYPGLHQALGVYLPLICCNSALLLHLDKHRAATAISALAQDTLQLGLGLLLVLVGFSALRELLINGSVLSDWPLLLPGAGAEAAADSLSSAQRVLASAPAALLLLGLLLAAGNWLTALFPAPADQADSGDEASITRARVSGGL